MFALLSVDAWPVCVNIYGGYIYVNISDIHICTQHWNTYIHTIHICLAVYVTSRHLCVHICISLLCTYMYTQVKYMYVHTSVLTSHTPPNIQHNSEIHVCTHKWHTHVHTSVLTSRTGNSIVMSPQFVNGYTWGWHTGWRRSGECLICIGHFPPKSPMISGSFAERDL